MGKKTVKLITFCMSALIIFLALSEAVKDSDLNTLCSVKGFYTEPKNSLDAVLIGASEIYTGYSPTQAWKQYGYTSYDFSSAGIPGNLYKSMLKEVLQRQNPKVIVFEINGFIYNEEYFTNMGNLHRYIDNIPLSKNWLKTIHEAVPKENQKDFLFPISTYHDNWKHPRKSLSTVISKLLIKLNGRSNLKGTATFSTCQTAKKIHKNKGIILTESGKKFLEELCQTCHEMGVENVLFVRFPHLRKTADPNVYTQIEKIVNSYGYDFLNMTDYQQLNLDIEKDFYNFDHMNYYGMTKFTNFLGEYLTLNYNLPVKHDTNTKKRWDFCTKKADKIFEYCKKDIDQKLPKHYTEMACYFKPKVISTTHKTQKRPIND